jgi:hypothetical protein
VHPVALVALPTLLAAAMTGEPAVEAAPATPTPWRFELKRSASERGTASESSRTTVRVEKFFDSVVAQLRADLPYVDKNNEFQSDPLYAGLGDLKCRVGFRGFPAGAARIVTNVDVVFPTAASEKLGNGKYQLGPGVEASIPLPAPWARSGPRLRFAPLIRQTFSVAGDPDRSDQNYTQLEAKLEAAWPDRFVVSVNPKPVIDWEQDGATAAVLQLEGAWLVSRSWRVWLKPGFRLWGPALPSTYDRQLELGVRLTI